MGKERLIQDGMNYVAHEIAPTLTPTVNACRFQVRLIGALENMAEIELRLVDKNGILVQSFGSKSVVVGKTITLDGVECNMNFLPKGKDDE